MAIETQGNFMVEGPEGERRAGFALESDREIFLDALEAAQGMRKGKPMRMMTPGEPFYEVPAEGVELPVFCESFLYERVGKTDARFILAVAQEYAYLIAFLGTPAIQGLLKQAKAQVPPPDYAF